MTCYVLAQAKGDQTTLGQGSGFCLEAGQLYGVKGDCKQLVIPLPLRERVMWLAHDSPQAMYQAADCTLAQITQQFYWLVICTQVHHYYVACPEC